YGSITEQEKGVINAFQNAYQLELIPTAKDINDKKVELKDSSIEQPNISLAEYETLYAKFYDNIRDSRSDVGLSGTPASNAGAADNSASSTNCNSADTQGIGWIICPVTNWLARGMDALYNILKSFLIVSPVA